MPDMVIYCGPGYGIPDTEIIEEEVTASKHGNLWFARLRHLR
jgi:hypothetical protein